ncbi:MAG TPA: DUF1572 family protein [Terracidiphilus sp.]|nr:DUF1572 family protein [Terracidiphilus sp.]HUA20586.1 DUF1572 family protein [Bryobacteraceae bacterium]
MPLLFTTSYLEDTLSLLRYYKGLGERAIAQVTEEQLTVALDEEMNSIAIIVKHLSGNMLSRFTGFPAADGEKPSRDRDREFADAPSSREAILRMWEHGWSCVFAALEPLSDADLAGVTMVRGERHSVMQAINRQLAHYAYHCGQIVFLAKHLRHKDWKSLSIPRGASARFNQRVQSGEASQR